MLATATYALAKMLSPAKRDKGKGRLRARGWWRPLRGGNGVPTAGTGREGVLAHLRG